ncbi:proteinase-activated receptor 3 [Poeciliopsis prolifica]|uniref:proteinase-activated receptor 3 n=1 Tax=Poeciliopsis prolifica TaxID=188132 RepID=UPI002412F3CF|nr:proteinase-activated receptor 3 [Poeciliopsis prolifica]
MRKLFILLLLVALFIHGTLQKHGGKKERKKVFPQPRVLLGHLPTQPDVGGTQPPNSTGPPSLVGLSDSAIEYLKGSLSTRVIPIIYLLAVIVGIPTNITILCLLATKIRKVSSAVLYCSLAVFDLFLLVSLFFKAHYHLLGNNWVLEEAACKAVTACFYGNLYGSALTLACIAVKRYMAVVHPFMYKTLPKQRCIAWAVLALWLVFGASVVPQMLVQQTFWVSQLNRTTCHDVMPLNYDSHKFLLFCNLTLAVLCLLVPMVVTTVCFVKILNALNRSHYDWAMYIKSSSLVFTIFLLCFLPVGVLHFLHYVQLSAGGADSLYEYFNMAVCLCCLHACLDPFFFILMSRSAGSKMFSLTFKGTNLSVSF